MANAVVVIILTLAFAFSVAVIYALIRDVDILWARVDKLERKDKSNDSQDS